MPDKKRIIYFSFIFFLIIVLLLIFQRVQNPFQWHKRNAIANNYYYYKILYFQKTSAMLIDGEWGEDLDNFTSIHMVRKNELTCVLITWRTSASVQSWRARLSIYNITILKFAVCMTKYISLKRIITIKVLKRTMLIVITAVYRQLWHTRMKIRENLPDDDDE